MKTATVSLKSSSSYSQSKYYDTPKLDKESHADYEKRTWRDRLHTTKDGKVFIPPMAFKNCIAEAAKYLAIKIPGKGNNSYTKHFESGILVTEPLILPNKKEKVEGEWFFVPADGRRGGNTRVHKCFPVIHEWEGKVDFIIFDDTVTKDIFKTILEEAGKFIGLGRFRPRNNGFYGRFSVENIKWS